MPKDLHNKDTFDIIPYGFEVDIIKDCSSLQNDIADVFNVIDRQCQGYVQTIQNVSFVPLPLSLLSHETNQMLKTTLFISIISVYTDSNGASKISWF